MDMNWIDEIRDPEPRKRYIYNADDYDPQYGDPYYREHSTRADSLWRLYEESGTSITFDAAGRHYDGGKESVDRFWNDLKTDRGLAVEPRYVELAFGCPPIEWDIDARVRDFAERMGDEYTSLYEQDTTSIKGGDFERFGAFADNHLDFIRALTKARGMDPISSDREIGAFLNTFDKLAAMPEPTPAKQEKDELSAGACDPADPLNLEQSSSYGMTR
ncbi:hypothetical protein PMS59_02370 [Bifidobacterium longum]|nr:hypothetical protein [Bifidobacterium longum]MDB6812057.1 hypothetical protein [Bifidobacterium longum]MDB6816630.1 hypothetical protein [Bifidobacterium longum]